MENSLKWAIGLCKYFLKLLYSTRLNYSVANFVKGEPKKREFNLILIKIIISVLYINSINCF